MSANFRDICVLFFVSTRNMLQTCFQLLWEFSSGISPNFLGLPFSYLQPRLPFSYSVMERAAKACEEPENTWHDQKLRYFKFSSLSHPGSSKSRFCWILLFFLALRAPQVYIYILTYYIYTTHVTEYINIPHIFIYLFIDLFLYLFLHNYMYIYIRNAISPGVP